MTRKESIEKIQKESVTYSGSISFVSRGIEPDVAGLLKAFHYGFDLGVECTKEEVLRILRLEDDGVFIMHDWEEEMLRKP